jgi:hypothetical protein
VRQPAGEACCWLVGVEFPHRRSRMNEPMKRVNLGHVQQYRQLSSASHT